MLRYLESTGADFAAERDFYGPINTGCLVGGRAGRWFLPSFLTLFLTLQGVGVGPHAGWSLGGAGWERWHALKRHALLYWRPAAASLPERPALQSNVRFPAALAVHAVHAVLSAGGAPHRVQPALV